MPLDARPIVARRDEAILHAVPSEVHQAVGEGLVIEDVDVPRPPVPMAPGPVVELPELLRDVRLDVRLPQRLALGAVERGWPRCPAAATAGLACSASSSRPGARVRAGTSTVWPSCTSASPSQRVHRSNAGRVAHDVHRPPAHGRGGRCWCCRAGQFSCRGAGGRAVGACPDASTGDPWGRRARKQPPTGTARCARDPHDRLSTAIDDGRRRRERPVAAVGGTPRLLGTTPQGRLAMVDDGGAGPGRRWALLRGARDRPSSVIGDGGPPPMWPMAAVADTPGQRRAALIGGRAWRRRRRSALAGRRRWARRGLRGPHRTRGVGRRRGQGAVRAAAIPPGIGDRRAGASTLRWVIRPEPAATIADTLRVLAGGVRRRLDIAAASPIDLRRWCAAALAIDGRRVMARLLRGLAVEPVAGGGRRYPRASSLDPERWSARVSTVGEGRRWRHRAGSGSPRPPGDAARPGFDGPPVAQGGVRPSIEGMNTR